MEAVDWKAKPPDAALLQPEVGTVGDKRPGVTSVGRRALAATGGVRGTLRRHARAASGIVLEQAALCFQFVHPGEEGQQTPPELFGTCADACQREVRLTASLSGSIGLPST